MPVEKIIANKKGKVAKVYCHDCDKDTNHKILFTAKEKEEYPEEVEEGEIEEITKISTYNVTRCMGCDSYSFMETRSYSNELDEHDEPILFVMTYPDENDFESDSEFFLKEHEIKLLPPLVRNLYLEIRQAYDNHAPILAAMGLRSLVEALCIHRRIAGSNLMQKIENLYRNDYISKREVPILHKLRELGNSTVHEIKKPSDVMLHSALTVINHILKTIYYLPKADRKLKTKKKDK